MTDILSLNAQIAALLRDGLTLRQVAERLPVNISRVHRVRVKYQIPLPPDRAKNSPAFLHNRVLLDDQVADALRAGLTQQQIADELNVSTNRVQRVRAQRHIPLPPHRTRRSRTDIAALLPRATEMLRAGASYTAIRAETGIGFNLISALRKKHQIPVPPGNHGGRPPSSIDEIFTRHARHAPDGHTTWAGPRSGRGRSSFDLLAEGGRHNARAVAFRKHHGRDPQGHLRRTCDIEDCIAGAHLTDALIRAKNRRTPR